VGAILTVTSEKNKNAFHLLRLRAISKKASEV
jgi:hypothetical protein